MSCQFKNECPSYSGWCEGPKQDFEKCIPFLVSACRTRIRVDEEMIGRLIDVVEDWLTEKNIIGLDDPMEVIIHGKDYYILACKFKEALGLKEEGK